MSTKVKADKLALAKQALQAFTAEGWSMAQATGLIANIELESAFDPHAVGDHGTAFGICQWHADRQAKFKAAFSKSIQDADYGEQLHFVMFELDNNEKHAGDVLRAATTAKEAGEAVSSLYERPLDPDGHVRAIRGQRAEDWFTRLS